MKLYLLVPIMKKKNVYSTRCFLIRRPTIKAYTRPLSCRSPDAFARALIQTAFGIQTKKGQMSLTRFDIRSIITENYILRNT